MTLLQEDAVDQLGPFVYENWQAHLAGLPSEIAYEFPLFTDAYIVGEIREGLGPYQLLNNVPIFNKNRPALILYVAIHSSGEESPVDWNKTDTTRYHGGMLSDEIAALVSLCLGIRLQAGEFSRVFDKSTGPRGLPRNGGLGPDPVLQIPERHPTIPGVYDQHTLESANILPSLFKLDPFQSVALVKSARLYQQAVWLCDSTPELSWVLLTSAIETAANEWRKDQYTPVERLRVSKLDRLITILSEKGGDELVEFVAQLIAPYLGSTKKFVEFMINFLPPPPDKRPAQHVQIPWNKKFMRDAFRTIYSYRSSALHNGIPFPDPMCFGAMKMSKEAYDEKIWGASSTKGGVWREADLPMNLHIFEYLVRNGLLNWWQSMANATQSF